MAIFRSHGKRESPQARRSAFDIWSSPGAFLGEVRWTAAETSSIETCWLIKIRPSGVTGGGGGGAAFGVGKKRRERISALSSTCVASVPSGRRNGGRRGEAEGAWLRERAHSSSLHRSVSFADALYKTARQWRAPAWRRARRCARRASRTASCAAVDWSPARTLFSALRRVSVAAASFIYY